MTTGATLVSTALPPGSHLVRFHPAPGAPYDRMIVVVDEWDTLFLMGWVGRPPSLSEWRHARDALFPDALFVRFERRKDGRTREVLMKIDKPA